jgi:FkbM family methyltransferase
MTAIREYLGLARSLAIYHGMPWRKRQLRDFYARFMGPGDLCFDIGAHVGSRIDVWLGLGARVVALEPQPRCLDWLQRRYRGRDGLILLDEAVGASSGRQMLLVSERTPTVSSLAANWVKKVGRTPGFSGVSWDHAVEVDVTTLDDLIKVHGLPVFCKIDVEGYECEVLRGLNRPLPALSFEYLAALPETALHCIERLGELGDYRYNWSRGERQQLQEPDWLSPEAMRRRLEALPTGSGDVYARRIGDG